jgi:hypothetical protein
VSHHNGEQRSNYELDVNGLNYDAAKKLDR